MIANLWAYADGGVMPRWLSLKSSLKLVLKQSDFLIVVGSTRFLEIAASGCYHLNI
jgi:hypothetical protein